MSVHSSRTKWRQFSNQVAAYTNLALNGVEKCVVVLAAAVASESCSELRLRESSVNSGNHSIDVEGITVHSIKLDDIDLPPQGSLLWMDIEGYEGHALLGASRLVASGVPVVSEFNPDFLRRSKGLEAFMRMLGERRIFDLAELQPRETSLDDLASRYVSGFTDILAV